MYVIVMSNKHVIFTFLLNFPFMFIYLFCIDYIIFCLQSSCTQSSDLDKSESKIMFRIIQVKQFLAPYQVYYQS